ncbi:hypothetical protein B0H11DRAFT_2233517 [Mycena galericulata]|nr:hypothetical protein B0H11DRAFT_2233517 [Mycena galericulata]
MSGDAPAAWGHLHAIASASGSAGTTAAPKMQDEGRRLASAFTVPIRLASLSAAAAPSSSGYGQPADGPADGPATGIKTWLTALLSLACPPTRSAFLTSALSLSALVLAPPAVTRLYQTLEVTFDPVSLCAEIAPVLRELKAEEDYTLYVPLLKRAVLSQLAHVYASGSGGGPCHALRAHDMSLADVVRKVWEEECGLTALLDPCKRSVCVIGIVVPVVVVVVDG